MGTVRHPGLGSCEFLTDRLQVGPWHSVGLGDDALAAVVAAILTERSATALPEGWRGGLSIERAEAWIRERDAESPTLLATERTSGDAIGLVIVYETPLDGGTVDVRIGYVIAEEAWGQGMATELVGGLVEWARPQPWVQTLTAGVETANGASTRVLTKNGFELVGGAEAGESSYRLRVAPTEL